MEVLSELCTIIKACIRFHLERWQSLYRERLSSVSRIIIEYPTNSDSDLPSILSMGYVFVVDMHGERDIWERDVLLHVYL